MNCQGWKATTVLRKVSVCHFVLCRMDSLYPWHLEVTMVVFLLLDKIVKYRLKKQQHQVVRHLLGITLQKRQLCQTLEYPWNSCCLAVYSFLPVDSEMVRRDYAGSENEPNVHMWLTPPYSQSVTRWKSIFSLVSLLTFATWDYSERSGKAKVSPEVTLLEMGTEWKNIILFRFVSFH